MKQNNGVIKVRLMVVHQKEATDQIIGLFRDKRYFDVTTQPNLHLITQTDTDILVVFESSISVSALMEKQMYLQDIKYQFLILEKDDEQAKDLCISKGIIPIVYHSDHEVVETVTETIYPDNPESKRLFLFMGADHKVGTTTIVHSVAEQLASHTKKNVMVVSLANKPNDEFAEFSRSTIDNIRVPITSKIISFTEIYRESDSIKNYRFLAGPRDLVHYRRYTVEEIIHFIEVLRSQEDYLILIDGGNDIDNPLVMAALQRVQNKYFVLANRKSHYNALDQKIEQVLKPFFSLSYSSFLYFLNHYDEEIENAQKIQERGGICASSIPFSRSGFMAEEQEISLATLDDEINRRIFNITKLIATKANCPIETVEVKQPFFKRLFKTKKGGELSGLST